MADEEVSEGQDDSSSSTHAIKEKQIFKAAGRAFKSMWKHKKRDGDFKTKVNEFLSCTIEYLKFTSKDFKVVQAVRKAILFEHVVIAQYPHDNLERALGEMFEITDPPLTSGQQLSASVVGGATTGAVMGSGGGAIGAGVGAVAGAFIGIYSLLSEKKVKEGWRLLAMAQAVQLFNSAFSDREEAERQFVKFANDMRESVGLENVGDVEAFARKVPAQVHRCPALTSRRTCAHCSILTPTGIRDHNFARAHLLHKHRQG